MSQVTAYSQLYPLVRSYLPGLTPDDNALILMAFQWAGREFARRTESFRLTLDPQAITDYQQDYNLTGLFPEYTAQVHRLLRVRVNGIEQDEDDYELYMEKYLRCAGQCAPHDLDDRLLKCGAAGTVTIATWQAITDGSVTITLSGTTYLVSAIDFSACADMDAIALAIQTAWRAKLESDDGYVRWYWSNAAHTAGYFVLAFETGTTSYLTAGTSGTDISGAGHMNGLTGGTGVKLGPWLDVKAVLRPDIRTEILPDWYVDRHAEALAAGAVVWLVTHPGTSRYSPDIFTLHNKTWNQAINEAKAEFCYGRDQKDGGIRVGA